MALSSAVIEQSTSKVFSYISTKVEDKALTADTIARLEIALSQIDFVLEKTGKIAITYVSLLRRWMILKRAHMEGTDLLNKYRPQYQPNGLQVTGEQTVVRSSSSSYLQRIANGVANLSISSLVGLSKERLTSSVAKTYERYAELAEKFVVEVESSCLLRHVSSRYPFLRHLFERKGLIIGYTSTVMRPSQSLGFLLIPMIVEGRGVEVHLIYVYEDCRMLEKYFFLEMKLRISEDTDIIGIIVKCIQRLTSQFKIVAESAIIGELTLLPNLREHTFMVEHEPDFDSKFFRPDPICCSGNSYVNLANKSSMEIPEPVSEIDFSCYVSAPKNSLRNAPLALTGSFKPHDPSDINGMMFVYGGKLETRNGGSVQQLEEITRSDALDYMVHDPEPTDYELWWFSTHGSAQVTLRQSMPRASLRRVSKRKR